MFQGKCVLITGAGGSIGSELARQALARGARKTVLFDRSEHGLHRLSLEMGQRPEAVWMVGDLLDDRRLGQAFAEHRPDAVLHAAAYKHVPLMEGQVSEAIRNNVIATSRLASQAVAHSASAFVLVSTDKAVKPVSVMGATKRMAELVVNSLSGQIRTATVRFGNVRESAGSVLPLFREQIAAGGPITVTHPEATRYFMTVGQAANLVLEAARLARGGETFLLEMGDPVRIRDLAERLAADRGIPIVYTGLRPGEKLHEDLVAEGERVEATEQPGIRVCRPARAARAPSNWREQLRALDHADPVPREEELKEWIRSWVPDYRS